MGQFKPPDVVKLVCGLIINDQTMLDSVHLRLQEYFGEMDYKSDFIRFDFTDYYTPEMGTNLQRQFISFEKLIQPFELAWIKRLTNQIEDEFGILKNEQIFRNVNIDPGYLTASNFILASTKNYSHRIYLQDCIYAELELIFKNKRFNSVPWTYPDYQTEVYQQKLLDIRTIYIRQLKQLIGKT